MRVHNKTDRKLVLKHPDYPESILLDPGKDCLIDEDELEIRDSKGGNE